MVYEKIGDAHNALKVPAKQEGQKLIIFGRIESEPIAYKSSGGNYKSPQFFHYGQRMGYDLTKGLDLNFDKGKRAQRPRLLSQDPKRTRLCIYTSLVRS